VIIGNYQIKNNPSATKFSFKMAEDFIPTNLNNFKSFFINKEKELINKYSNGFDGNTGLGKNSITSRYSKYNLLNFPEMFFLKNIIKQKHDEFVKQIKSEVPINFYIQCWFNVMRKGDQIKKHHHSGPQTHCFISGNICVNTENSYTYYDPPFFNKVIKTQNINNKVTLFPSWLEHYTDEVKHDYDRITIGFDINYEVIPEQGVWVKLD